MSSIPSSAMPHAHVHHDEPEKPKAAKPGRVREAATSVSDTVKANPKTSAAVGIAVLAGAAAAVAAPLLKAKKASPKPKTAAKPKAASKPAAAKTTTAKPAARKPAAAKS